jgi:hypothetical protein
VVEWEPSFFFSVPDRRTLLRTVATAIAPPPQPSTAAASQRWLGATESTQSNTTFVGHGVHVVSGCPKLNEMSPIAIASSTGAPSPNAITERTLAMLEAYKLIERIPAGLRTQS